MALSFGGSGFSAQKSIGYMSKTKSLMDKSMERIASGNKILTAGDDPGGLAVSMRLKNELSTLVGAKDRVQNAKSFVEMQDTALSTAGDILSEMSSVKTNYEGAASSTLKESYATQFKELQVQLNDLLSEKVNGTSLFSSQSSTSKTIYTSSQGSSGASVTLDNLDLSAGLSISAGVNLSSAGSTASAVSVSDISSSSISSALDNIASLRAESGGDLSTLGFASDYLSNMSTSLETAHGRIMDVDLAEESANYAKLTMQYEAAAAAVAQANVAMGVVLDLLLTSVNRD